jgi:hypothetical protein
MSRHRFQIGARVRSAESRQRDPMWAAEYYVIGLLPGEEPQYEVRAADDLQEFVLLESELQPSRTARPPIGCASPWSA